MRFASWRTKTKAKQSSSSTTTPSSCISGESLTKSGNPPRRPKFNKSGHRSGFETLFNKIAESKGLILTYEDPRSLLSFITQPKKRVYHPDFTAAPGWYIETKGRMVSADRAKLVLIKEQHPTARILIIFQRPGHTISKQSKTTYSAWADKHGFE